MVTKEKDHGLWMRWREVQESYANRWRDAATEPRSGDKAADAGHRQRERPRADHAHRAFGPPRLAAFLRGESPGGVEGEMIRDELPWIAAFVLLILTIVVFEVI